ncbi:PREDICTED: uncharacterized protein LOC105955039 [Erythranthe guttata]|uniref:uncharacterized protein LOC105955039 n=1 Tax=Erythranthe guttata TaxID=4155 RepID=UPI00064E023C|nr:PREDICTED: uncharacterized protein LOC105955039 [Erythranthe guttata]|eukprot:XP_012834191.1 PREDICTED: uncharacterized protein LOC105955039 [Erythranthe guttata]
MSRLINKEWMNESDRGGHVYTKGVEDFLEFADRTNVTELATIPCPCVKCRNRMRHTPINVRKHLVRNGIDKSYTLWALHGEKPFVNSFIDPIAEDAHQENIREEQILVRELEMRNLVDNIHGLHGEYEETGGVGQEKVSEEQHFSSEKYNEYKRLSSEKLYSSCEGSELIGFDNVEF